MTSIGILGPVTVIGDDGEPALFRAVRRRALLAMLAARHGHVVAIDVLIDLLWPLRLPEHPEAALQSQVHHLRRQLGPLGSTLVTEESGYRLDCRARRCRRPAVRATDRRHRCEYPTEAALDDVEDARAVAGPAFGDLASIDVFHGAADRLEGLRVDAVERRVELLLRAGRDTEAGDAAATLALQQPYREGPVALQMRALARLGRHVEGLRAFADFRHRLVEELGVEPSPAAPRRRAPTARPRQHADDRRARQLVRRSPRRAGRGGGGARTVHGWSP